jgi:Poly(ADP-ribose) polymerase catalytic domain
VNDFIGRGAYFAQDSRKSHSYARSNAGNVRVMFFNKVLLGDVSIQPQTDDKLVSAPKGYHSVQGTAFNYTEYIVHRYGRAFAFLKITYQTPNWER